MTKRRVSEGLVLTHTCAHLPPAGGPMHDELISRAVDLLADPDREDLQAVEEDASEGGAGGVRGDGEGLRAVGWAGMMMTESKANGCLAWTPSCPFPQHNNI